MVVSVCVCRSIDQMCCSSAVASVLVASESGLRWMSSSKVSCAGVLFIRYLYVHSVVLGRDGAR